MPINDKSQNMGYADYANMITRGMDELFNNVRDVILHYLQECCEPPFNNFYPNLIDSNSVISNLETYNVGIPNAALLDGSYPKGKRHNKQYNKRMQRSISRRSKVENRSKRQYNGKRNYRM